MARMSNGEAALYIAGLFVACLVASAVVTFVVSTLTYRRDRHDLDYLRRRASSDVFDYETMSTRLNMRDEIRSRTDLTQHDKLVLLGYEEDPDHPWITEDLVDVFRLEPKEKP
jgi:hypothetical protein